MATRAETNAEVRRWLQTWDVDDAQMTRLSNLITDSMYDTGNMKPDNHQLLVWALSGLSIWFEPHPLEELLASIPGGVPLTDGNSTRPAREWVDLVIDLRGDDVTIGLGSALMIDGRIHLVSADGNMDPSAYLSTVDAWTTASPT